MRIDADLVQELRLSNSWSQEELAIASGLNRRTIQRIEATATASLQSLKALASAFEINVDDLRLEDEIPMQKYEYKTVDLPIKHALRKNTVDIETVLNEEADDGWRLFQVLAPSLLGQSDRMVAVLERPCMRTE